MTPDEMVVFQHLQVDVIRVFGEDARVYRTPFPREMTGFYEAYVSLSPSSTHSSFVLTTTGTSLFFALKDMKQVLEKLQPRVPS